jgi:hypothetical protein
MITEHCGYPAGDCVVPKERLRILVTASGGVIQEIYCSEGDAQVFILDMDELAERSPEDGPYDCWIPDRPAPLTDFRRDCDSEIQEHEELAKLAEVLAVPEGCLIGEIRCPAKARHEGDVVGCGSTNIDGPDFEGLYDCLDCGIWFNAESAEPVSEGA